MATDVRRPLVVLTVTFAPAIAATEPPPLTHTTPLTPTGEVVERGHIQRLQSMTAFYHQFAFGLGHGLELRAAFPGAPIPILGADLELRWAPLVEGPIALVLGASGTVEWVNGADLWFGTSATLAWRDPAWGLHVNWRQAEHAGDDDRLTLVTAGGSVRAGRALLFVEVGQLAWSAPVVCGSGRSSETGEGGGRPPSIECIDRAAGGGVWLGAWWDAGDARVGLSALVARAGDTTIPIVPVLSAVWDHE